MTSLVLGHCDDSVRCARKSVFVSGQVGRVRERANEALDSPDSNFTCSKVFGDLLVYRFNAALVLWISGAHRQFVIAWGVRRPPPL